MPAGPVGSVWASGSWSDTAWEADTWADAVVPSGGMALWQGPIVVAVTRLVWWVISVWRA